MAEFSAWTLLIGVGTTMSFLWASMVVRDVFHPAAFLSPFVGFLYVYLPWELYKDGLLVSGGHSIEELASVQGFNAACAMALLFGCVISTRRGSELHRNGSVYVPSDYTALANRAFRAALIFGGVSLVAYAVTLGNVGGIVGAYSVEKGGGYSVSGYVRDAVTWSLTALGLIYFRISQRKAGWPQYLALICFACPLIIHALLSARRGPTFTIFSLLFFGWYLAKKKRPEMFVFIAGGGALGLLMLVMVTFRDSFKLGSELYTNPTQAAETIAAQFKQRRAEQIERNLAGNEFVYGVTVVKEFSESKDFFWGKRLAMVLLIRPIPRQLWPTKYEDVGLGHFEVNAGLGIGDNYADIAYGAAPGFAADLFAEFSWAAIGFSFLAGYGYGIVWGRCVRFGGIWLVLYLLMVAFSIFFAMQTIEAILYRLAFTFVPVALVWRYYIAPTSKRKILKRARRLPQTRIFRN
jgi:hypothetical protein